MRACGDAGVVFGWPNRWLGKRDMLTVLTALTALTVLTVLTTLTTLTTLTAQTTLTRTNGANGATLLKEARRRLSTQYRAATAVLHIFSVTVPDCYTHDMVYGDARIQRNI